jgi:hypothetical protein
MAEDLAQEICRVGRVGPQGPRSGLDLVTE